MNGSLFRSERRYLLVPAGVVALLIAACALAVLWLADGHYTFAVDDPYIHLALAKNIARGQYGINPGEFSAPSSSVLWPFLLAPFAGSWHGVLFPVLFNALCALASVTLFAITCDRVLEAENRKAKRALVWGLTLLFAVATNQVGLALLGMEHSLQVLCAVWLTTLIIRESRGGSPSSLAIGCAIALGPVVRYEMVGPSLLAAAYFAYRRRTTPAVLGLCLAFAALGGFSLWLVAHGQGALPSSVVAKSGAEPGQSLLVTALNNVRAQLHSGWAVILACFGSAALLYARRKQLSARDQPLAALLLLTLLGHLLVGRSGWFGRYEAYALAIAYVLALALFATEISAWTSQRPPACRLFGMAAFAAILCSRYVGIILTTPLGALNVYQQQAQVARFVGSFYRKPVGVNDLGYVAWQSKSYVLDFVGLASREAFLAQRVHPKDANAWIGELTHAHDVHFAAIYDSWFNHLPATWLRCGFLHLGAKRVTAAGETVAFYALDEATRSEIRPQLREWAATLPPGVRFEFSEGCR